MQETKDGGRESPARSDRAGMQVLSMQAGYAGTEQE